MVSWNQDRFLIQALRFIYIGGRRDDLAESCIPVGENLKDRHELKQPNCRAIYCSNHRLRIEDTAFKSIQGPLTIRVRRRMRKEPSHSLDCMTER